MTDTRRGGNADFPGPISPEEQGRRDYAAFLPRCSECDHRADVHERPYGCADCACEIGYWGGDEP